MPMAKKAAYYRSLKDAGVPLDKHYRHYTTEELSELYEVNKTEYNLGPIEYEEPSPTVAPPKDSETAVLKAQIAELQAAITQLASVGGPSVPEYRTPQPAEKHHSEAGVTSITHSRDDILEVDEQGLQWYQREVPKASYAKPRGRRVVRYEDPGVRTQTLRSSDGQTETFEVAGDPANARTTEARITLPSYQTGIYRDPGLPFRIHTYQGARGFDLFDVEEYFGGPDLVPGDIRKVYVGMDLTYDIQTTIRSIEAAYRLIVLNDRSAL